LLKIQDAKIKQKSPSPSAHLLTTLSDYIFLTKECIDNRKKLLKQQYLHISSQYGELYFGSVTAEIGWRVWGTQQISTAFASWQRYYTDVAERMSTKLCTIIGSLLGWYTIYTFSLALAPLTEFCHYKIHFASKSCVLQLSSILAALLHGSQAVGISQTLRCGTKNGITELLLLVIFNRGRHLYSDGGHHVGGQTHITVS